MNEMPKLRLVPTLVGWVHPQVMVFLGKVANPLTQKMERNLPAARSLIDLLAELDEKTEGRLEDAEKRLLQSALTELRLNYLDELNKPEPSAAAADQGTAGAESDRPEAAPSSNADPAVSGEPC
jgi:hypothetical protein